MQTQPVSCYKMEETVTAGTMNSRDTRVLARVRAAIELVQNDPEPVLILNNCCLTSIPNPVLSNQHCLQHLRQLCLKNNRIVSLPEGISKLKALSKLYLPTNNLEHLPEVLADLPCLSLLDVSNNDISSISPSIANMKALEDLNIGNNKLTHLPDELWRVPCLRCLNAHGNQLNTISLEIVHCQSLSKLLLDCNNLSSLPMQITKLPNLKNLSLAGNKLRSLPNGFSGSMLQVVLVDTNFDLSCIPVSLAPVSWWGTLGVEGCSVRMKQEDLFFLKRAKTCSQVPSLTELTARVLHSILKASLRGSVTLWLPQQLCSLLQLPLGLDSWLVPTGRCSECLQVYFQHHFDMLVSGMLYKRIDAQGRCKPNDLLLSITCCSAQCTKSYFSAY